MVTQEPILQVDLGLTNQVVSRQPIPVHDSHCEGVVLWEGGRELKHLPKERVQLVGDVVILVVDLALAQFDLEVRVGLAPRILRLEVDSL